MKRVALPKMPLVPPEAVERLQRKFVAVKEAAEADRFWEKLQRARQPKPIDYDGMPIG